MSAYGDDPRFHAIEDEAFVCTAPDDAPCRTVPTCECESWCCCDGSPEDAADTHDEGQHCCMTTVETGRGCWIEPWVNATGLEDSYGDDPLKVWTYDADEESHWPDGPVTCDWDGDYVPWEYALAATAATRLHQQDATFLDSTETDWREVTR